MFNLFGVVGGFIAWVVIGVAVLAAVHGFDLSRQNIGREAQRQEDAPVMALCDSLPQPTGLFSSKLKPSDCAKTLHTGLDAIVANERLKGEFKTLGTERQECSDKVTKLETATARSAVARAKRKPEDERKLAEITPEKEEMIAALGLPTPNMTCEARLARRDAMWAKIAAQRARDFPQPPGGSKPQSGDVMPQ